MEAAALKSAVQGRLTRLKRVVFALGDEPVEFVGYELGSRPDFRRFIGVDPEGGPEFTVSEYRFPTGDLLLEEGFAD